MERSTFQLDEAKAKADQLAQQLDSAVEADRSNIEAELRTARDEVQALTDAQVQDVASDATPKRDATSGDTKREPEQGRSAANDSEFNSLEKGAQVEPGIGGGDDFSAAARARRFARADELYETLRESGYTATPEMTAALDQIQQREAHEANPELFTAPNAAEAQVEIARAGERSEAPERDDDPAQVRGIRDGEAVEGTIEDRVTVDGQSFDVLRVEHDNGSSERVLVPADPDHDIGDRVQASREGSEIEVARSYDHGI